MLFNKTFGSNFKHVVKLLATHRLPDTESGET